MEKVVNEHGQMVLKREHWMQQIMNSTYNDMIVVAILSKDGLAGAWEMAISDHLKRLWKNPLNYPYLKELFKETGVEGITAHTFDKAAQLIFNSKIIDK